MLIRTTTSVYEVKMENPGKYRVQKIATSTVSPIELGEAFEGNVLAFDREGRLVLCQGERIVLRTSQTKDW